LSAAENDTKKKLMAVWNERKHDCTARQLRRWQNGRMVTMLALGPEFEYGRRMESLVLATGRCSGRRGQGCQLTGERLNYRSLPPYIALTISTISRVGVKINVTR